MALVFFATAVIMIFYIMVFGRSKNISLKTSLGTVKRIVKRAKKNKPKNSKDTQFEDMKKIKLELI